MGARARTLPTSLRVLVLTTLQQAGLTSIRFGLPVLATYWRDALHLTLAQVGVLLGAFDLGALLLLFPLGLLADQWGERAVLAGGALFTAAMTASVARAQSFAALVVLLAFAGLGYGSGQTAGTKAVAAAFGAAGRGLAMGIRQSGLPLGGLLAALLLPPLAARAGWHGAVIAAALLCLVPGILCWVGLPHEDPGTLRSDSLRALPSQIRAILRDPGIRRTTGVAALLVAAQFCYQGYLALYLVDRFGMSKAGAAGLLAAVHLGGVVGRLFWGLLSDRTFAGRRTPALGWCVGAGAAFPLALVALPPHAPVVALGLVAFAGGALLLGWNGLYSTLIMEHARGDRAGTAMGLSMTVLYTTTVMTPPLFGWVVDQATYAAGWLAVAGLLGAAWAEARRIPEPRPEASPEPVAARRAGGGRPQAAR